MLGADMRRILVPVDLSGATSLALQRAREFARRFNAVIDLLHVVPSALNASRRDPNPPVPGLAGVLKQEARRELNKLVANLWEDDVMATVVVREGQPHDVILTEAHFLNADLIVMGAYEQNWLSRLLGKSTVERVVQSARCPVIVFRAAANGARLNSAGRIPA
jgi:nucleotide-binding universal stress UspA family protein